MKANKIFISAIVGAMLTFGIGSTSSAAELSSDLSTLQVESQQTLSHHHSPHHRVPPHHDNRHYDRQGGNFGNTSYGSNRGGNYNSPRNTRNGSRNVNVNVSRTEVRRVDINVNSSRRV